MAPQAPRSRARKSWKQCQVAAHGHQPWISVLMRPGGRAAGVVRWSERRSWVGLGLRSSLLKAQASLSQQATAQGRSALAQLRATVRALCLARLL
jgi:hypothetical protein